MKSGNMPARSSLKQGRYSWCDSKEWISGDSQKENKSKKNGLCSDGMNIV